MIADTRHIEYLVHRILSGKHIFSYQDDTYELRKPSLKLKLESDFMHQQAYADNLYSDFILLEDIPSLAIEIGLIGLNYKSVLTSLEKTLENDKVNYFQNFLDPQKKKRNKTKLDNTKKQLSKQLNYLHYLDYLSLEHFCDKIKNEFIIINTLYYYNTSQKVFDYDNIDYYFFNQLMGEIANDMIDIETYKCIARNAYWKNFWSNNKHKLLDEPVNEWSDEQKTIFNISTMYDRVYEHPDCPVEDIINDDDALDGWMIHQKRENLKEKQTKGVDNMLPEKIRNSSEIFMMAQDKEQIENIRGFNSQESLAKFNSKINYIQSSKKPVQEAQLPDVQQAIMQQLNKGK